MPAIATADRSLAIQESGRLGSFLRKRRAIALGVLYLKEKRVWHLLVGMYILISCIVAVLNREALAGF